MAISSRTLKSPGFLIAALSALSLGIVGFGLFIMLRSDSSAVAPPLEEPATKARAARQITALGRIEPEGGIYNVAAPSARLGSARVLHILVQEGGQVQQGQPLAVMDSYEQLRASAIQAEAQVLEAETNLGQVKAGAKTGDIQSEIAAAEASQANVRSQAAEVDAKAARAGVVEAELRKAQADLERYQQLRQDGAISESDLEVRQLALITKQRELDEALRQLDRARSELDAIAKRFEQAKQTVVGMREVRPEDVQRAEAGIQSALANLARAKAELDQAAVLAPVDGQVLEIHTRDGEAVGEQGILDLARTDRMTVVAEVYETDVRDVKAGQPVEITSPALSRPLQGRVALVGLKIDKKDVLDTDPAADTDARVVEVTVLLENGEPVANLTNLQVNVAIDTAARALRPGPALGTPKSPAGRSGSVPADSGLNRQLNRPGLSGGGLLKNGLLDGALSEDEVGGDRTPTAPENATSDGGES